jgi:uncharacterized protein (DUF4415 family)
MESLTDWDYLADPTDEGIDYTDVPSLDERFFERAVLRTPKGQGTVTLRLDRDVLVWFRAQGEELEKRVNSILRA